MSTPRRINISIDRELLERIDQTISGTKITRSGFLSSAAIERLERDSRPLTASQKKSVMAAVNSALRGL